MSGLKSQRKGKSGEREARILMQAIVDKAVAIDGKIAPGLIQVQRNLLQSASGGRDLLGCPGMAIEVKRCQKKRMNLWWTQAVDQAIKAGPDKAPVLLWRLDREPWRMRVYAKFPIVRDEALEGGIDLEKEEFCTWAVDYIRRKLAGKLDNGNQGGYIENSEENRHD